MSDRGVEKGLGQHGKPRRFRGRRGAMGVGSAWVGEEGLTAGAARIWHHFMIRIKLAGRGIARPLPDKQSGEMAVA